MAGFSVSELVFSTLGVDIVNRFLLIVNKMWVIVNSEGIGDYCFRFYKFVILGVGGEWY